MFLILILLLSHSQTEAGKGKPTKGPWSYCEVQDNVTTHLYNFTSMPSALSTHTLAHNDTGEVITLRLCSPLTETCNGRDGAAICLKRKNVEIVIGKFPPKVIQDPGRVQFKYVGDLCNGTVNYTVTVIMKCDYTKTASAPELFPHQYKDQCQLFLVWSNDVVCGPHRKEIDCSVRDEKTGRHYDLNPLKRYLDNYVVPVNDNRSMIVNVCHSVIYGYKSTCTAFSGICLYDASKSAKQLSTSLGDIGEGPFLDGDVIRLQYTEGGLTAIGDKCENKNALHYKSTITFTCDLNATDTLPVFDKFTKDCEYLFSWKTRAACSLEDQKKSAAVEVADASCTVEYGSPPRKFDLSVFHRGEIQRVKSHGKDAKEYQVNICNGPSECKDGATICSGSESYGSLATAIWDNAENTLRLKYSNGSRCTGDGDSNFSELAFICRNSSGIGTPQVAQQLQCGVKLEWYTSVICTTKAPLSNETMTKPTEDQKDLGEPKKKDTTSASTTSTPSSSSSSPGGVTIIVSLSLVAIILATIFYLRTSPRRFDFPRRICCCCNPGSAGSSRRVEYCRVNTTEEARLLLDATDPTSCQTLDSDDELLGA